MEQAGSRRLHVAYATDWMDAIITILEPRSPYRPWQHGSGYVQSGDTVMFLVDTDPPSMPTDRVEVGTDGDLRSAVFVEALNQTRPQVDVEAVVRKDFGTWLYWRHQVVKGVRSREIAVGRPDS